MVLACAGLALGPALMGHPFVVAHWAELGIGGASFVPGKTLSMVWDCHRCASRQLGHAQEALRVLQGLHCSPANPLHPPCGIRLGQPWSCKRCTSLLPVGFPPATAEQGAPAPPGDADLSPAMQAVAVRPSQVGPMARQTGGMETLSAVMTAVCGGIA